MADEVSIVVSDQDMDISQRETFRLDKVRLQSVGSKCPEEWALFDLKGKHLP
jgi:hypothetical protein